MGVNLPLTTWAIYFLLDHGFGRLFWGAIVDVYGFERPYGVIAVLEMAEARNASGKVPMVRLRVRYDSRETTLPAAFETKLGAQKNNIIHHKH